MQDKTKPPSHKGTKNSFPEAAKLRSAKPTEGKGKIAPTPSPRQTSPAAPNPRVAAHASAGLDPSDDDSRDGIWQHPKLRSGKAKRASYPPNPTPSTSGKILATAKPIPKGSFNALAIEEPPSPSKRSKTFKRSRTASQDGDEMAEVASRDQATPVAGKAAQEPQAPIPPPANAEGLSAEELQEAAEAEAAKEAEFPQESRRHTKAQMDALRQGTPGFKFKGKSYPTKPHIPVGFDSNAEKPATNVEPSTTTVPRPMRGSKKFAIAQANHLPKARRVTGKSPGGQPLVRVTSEEYYETAPADRVYLMIEDGNSTSESDSESTSGRERRRKRPAVPDKPAKTTKRDRDPDSSDFEDEKRDGRAKSKGKDQFPSRNAGERLKETIEDRRLKSGQKRHDYGLGLDTRPITLKQQELPLDPGAAAKFKPCVEVEGNWCVNHCRPASLDAEAVRQQFANVRTIPVERDQGYNAHAQVFMHQAEIDGSCLFSASSKSLEHILMSDDTAYGLDYCPSAAGAIENLMSRQNLREQACDYLRINKDTVFENLGFMTPRETVMRDYIAEGNVVNDPDVPYDQQRIYTLEDYIGAMSRPHASGDELMITMITEILNIRMVVIEIGVSPVTMGMTVSTHMDMEPRQPKMLTLQRLTPRNQHLSSRMSIILLKSGAHFDWAHLTSDPCDDAEEHCLLSDRKVLTISTIKPLVKTLVSVPQADCEHVKLRPQLPEPGLQVLPNRRLLCIATQRKNRQQTVQALVDEERTDLEGAESVVALFERNGKHASLQDLPTLYAFLNVHDQALKKAADKAAGKPDVPDVQPTIASSSRHVAANAAKRADSAREALDAALNELRAASANTIADEAELREGAANAVKIMTKCTLKVAMDRVAHHLSFTNSHAEAVQAAVQDINSKQVNYEYPPIVGKPPSHHFNDSGVPFMEEHLGQGTREMTLLEVADAEIAATRSATTGHPMELLPRALHKYWQHHVEATAATPRGNLTIQQHQKTIRTIAQAGLFQEACDAAAKTRDAAHATRQSSVAELATRTAQGAPVIPPATTFATTSASFLTPMSTPTHAPPPEISLKHHASPNVRMAASRQEQGEAAKAAATTVVIVQNNKPKGMQWKAGTEQEGKGFFRSTWLAVQRSWEEVNNSSDKSAYTTLRSQIHWTIQPVVQAELQLTRDAWDRISDAEIIVKMDKIFAPISPAEYVIKLRAITMDTDESKGSILQRYRAYAEPFLQIIAEAHDAGCSINDDAIKLSFKTACSTNDMLLLWFTETKWTTLMAAHQRQVLHLKSFESHEMHSKLNKAKLLRDLGPGAVPPPPAQQQQPMQQMQQMLQPPAQQQQAPPAQAPAAPPPAIPHQRQQWTPEQRALHQQQGRERAQAREQQNQQVMVNMLAQSVSNALQAQHQFIPAPVAPQPQYAQPSHQNVQPIYAPTAPAYSPAPHQAMDNAFYPAPRQPAAPPAAAPAPYIHPGLDSRGPNWHSAESAQCLKCRYLPCTAIVCQGCGDHGHTAADCRKRGRHAMWNTSGYYCEKRPGQPALVYDGTNQRAQQQPAPLQYQFQPPPAFTPQQPQGHNTTAAPQYQYVPLLPAPLQLPQSNSTSAPPAFPTPHTFMQAPRYTPVTRSANVTVQTQDPPAPQQGTAAP